MIFMALAFNLETLKKDKYLWVNFHLLSTFGIPGPEELILHLEMQ